MILVFGKTGQVALELGRYSNVLALDRKEADFTNVNECIGAIKKYTPAAVINAAAYTDVDHAEFNYEYANQVNGHTPGEIAKICAEMRIPFLHISTDYVFDGSGMKPWEENATPSPLNAYGKSKALGEALVKSSGAIYVILRTSWTFSLTGKNFLTTMQRLSEVNDELKIVNDQIGGPTPAKELASACYKIIKQLLEKPEKSGIYHYSGTPNISRAEFAEKIFKELKVGTFVTPVASSQYSLPAMRPLNSRLNCTKTKEVFGLNRPNWYPHLKYLTHLAFQRLN